MSHFCFFVFTTLIFALVCHCNKTNTPEIGPEHVSQSADEVTLDPKEFGMYQCVLECVINSRLSESKSSTVEYIGFCQKNLKQLKPCVDKCNPLDTKRIYDMIALYSLKCHTLIGEYYESSGCLEKVIPRRVHCEKQKCQKFQHPPILNDKEYDDGEKRKIYNEQFCRYHDCVSPCIKPAINYDCGKEMTNLVTDDFAGTFLYGKKILLSLNNELNWWPNDPCDMVLNKTGFDPDLQPKTTTTTFSTTTKKKISKTTKKKKKSAATTSTSSPTVSTIRTITAAVSTLPASTSKLSVTSTNIKTSTTILESPFTRTLKKCPFKKSPVSTSKLLTTTFSTSAAPVQVFSQPETMNASFKVVAIFSMILFLILFELYFNEIIVKMYSI